VQSTVPPPPVCSELNLHTPMRCTLVKRGHPCGRISPRDKERTRAGHGHMNCLIAAFRLSRDGASSTQVSTPSARRGSEPTGARGYVRSSPMTHEFVRDRGSLRVAVTRHRTRLTSQQPRIAVPPILRGSARPRQGPGPAAGGA
jgi:hypothetical protein